ncbi:tetratricopeptide repeat protein [Candidatus Competibacter phosphatis]|uniref:Tetratricopeptide repeat protein n=1 Tax=Candidatus Competibacter phosphatis TaxID=221280 RepID=A0ABX1TMR6_9GAMM|nr:trypsin-like peptidase domain-containing protein [Candidatus Competibacter phosphatis]NMQ19428.1 tetratricopeptide repeat protein [Candidatus Competibacter phosphatis]
MNFPLLAFRGVALALALTGALPASASQYETIDYYVQQMIALASANEEAGVLIFREQIENLPRPEPGDARQASPFSQHGQERLAGGQLKEALAAFRQAFIADPADPEIAGALGLTYLRLRRFKEAERLLVYALSLAPTRSASWLALGQVYGQQGDVRRATGAFVNALRFAQDQPQATEQLRQLATADPADAVRIGALQALRATKPAPATKPVPLTDSPPPQPAVPVQPGGDSRHVSEIQTTPSTTTTRDLLGSLKQGLALLAKPADPATAEPTASPAADNGNPGQRIYRRGMPLTCLIVTFQDGKTANLGSGLLVSKDGLVITNNHVIDKAENLAVRCGDRESVARIRKRSKEPDLALLATKLKSKESFILNQTYSQDLIGLDVFVIGNPYGLESTFSTGVISGLREIDGVRYIQISAPISPGNSGGPVILRDGTVIGVATMGLKVGQNLNFAIAAADVIASPIFAPKQMQVRSVSAP